MKSYYVAKTTASGFIGAFTFDQIESLLKSNVITADCVATESTGPSYNQLMESGGVTWVPVSQLQRSADEPTTTTVARAPVGGLQSVGTQSSGLAIISTSTLLGVFFGGMGGVVYLLGLVAESDSHPEANFMGVLTVFALLQGGFVLIVSAILGAPAGALIGILISAFSRKR